MIADADWNVPEIGGKADLDAFGMEGEPDRVGGVMRNGEGHDLDIADEEAPAGGKYFELRKLGRLSGGVADRTRPRLVGGAGHENRDAELLGQRGQPVNVIAMLVRNHDCGKRVGI